jgi:hypothetical protein
MNLSRVQVRLRLSLAAISWLILLATAVPGAFAQASIDIFVTPVPNVPFSGTVVVERSSVRQNGAVINLKTLRNIGRDSRGRIYNESRALVPVPSTVTPKLLAIHLYDPQTRTSTRLNPQQRTFWTRIVNRPPATQPPALFYASSGGNVPQNQFATEEDLGTRQMDGLPAHGVRETQTIPAAMSGTGKEIVTSDEYWYSDDLRINLVIKHNDPRTGTVKMTVTQIMLSEPNPDLFRIPDEYTPAGTRQAADQ